MNADQLWDTTMNPATRLLIRVTIDDAARAERRVTTLMGNKVEPRRKWIERNVSFTLDEVDDALLSQSNSHEGQEVTHQLLKEQEQYESELIADESGQFSLFGE